ncbi:hypothetical protein FACS189427_07620 [Planctomycetales bacterium]|nr:hypothetical protein FACS189427_07620 [Planctomycetales bacterium]
MPVGATQVQTAKQSAFTAAAVHTPAGAKKAEMQLGIINLTVRITVGAKRIRILPGFTNQTVHIQVGVRQTLMVKQ